MYSRNMEIILDITSMVSTYLFTYLVTMFTLKIFGEQLKKIYLYVCIIINTILYSVFVFTTYAFYNFQSIPDNILMYIVLPNPAVIIITHILGIKFLKIAKSKQNVIIRFSLLYTMFGVCLNLMIRRTFFIKYNPYNYFSDFIGLIVCLVLHFILIKILSVLFSKYKNLTMLPDIITVKNARSELFSSLSVLGASYLLISAFISIPKYSSASAFVCCVIIVLIMCIDYLFIQFRAMRSIRETKITYIQSLKDSVANYGNIRFEYNEILKKYDQYLENGDFFDLQQYYESMSGKINYISEKLNLTRKLKQNPALVALLIQKIDYSDNVGVQLCMPVICDLENLYIDILDLCRVIGNLLDNAIEAAIPSAGKHVNFSIESKNNGDIIIIITNDMCGKADFNMITSNGLSMKKGHSGIGINNVLKILRNYGNCSINFVCGDNNFTVYIEILSLSIPRLEKIG